MSVVTSAKRSGLDVLTAVQFLTRIPLRSLPYRPDSLASAVKYFPLVGVIVGGAAALLHMLLAPHLGRVPAALLVVVFLVWVTGCFHEDAIADSFDGFGGGYGREKILLILRDSRIGSYGAAALSLSLLARVMFLSALPLAQVGRYLIAAHVLCRWTTLPLSYFLPPARESEEGADGQGGRIARLTTRASLAAGSVFTLAVAIALLRWHAIAPICAALLITVLSGRFYMRKVGGVTGDGFGATNQLTEVAVYLCGAWII